MRLSLGATALVGMLVLGGCATPQPGPGPSRTAAPAVSPAVSPTVPPAVSPTVPPTVSPTVPRASAAEPVPMFASSVGPITPELAERMAASWRPGCPVPLEDLRYVTVAHVDPDGVVRTGELVVHADVADGIVGVFAALFEARYPISSMRLVDDFGADDSASMAADNTSAFNCRPITGGTAWSEHAYGTAIDVNPVENPYVVGGHVAPRAGREFTSRPDLPGVIHPDDAVVTAFAAAGWQWGGAWSSPIDYQHFSVSGR
ncbi:M15 family metallopeptidase [Cellulomonas sp. KRMCY2]|uniref:M15 family metallopeptidase n=1 Tax=Cellulomonas sp. KRMCY2 TaxID=1304865 RepID=UPI000685E3C3|nr:M15 family metallopeptidase [Cellulomonas sp. KRMCY2]